MQHNIDARSATSVRAKHSKIETHVDSLSKLLFNAKDLQRIRALGMPPPERLRGVMAKLLPPSVHDNPEPIDVSPLTPKDFLLLPDVQTIIAIRGYDREHQERHVLFAKRITFLLRDKSVTEKNIRDAIMLFLRMYPESLATKRGT